MCERVVTRNLDDGLPRTRKFAPQPLPFDSRLSSGNMTHTCATTYFKPSWLHKVGANATFRSNECCALGKGGRTRVFVGDNW